VDCPTEFVTASPSDLVKPRPSGRGSYGTNPRSHERGLTRVTIEITTALKRVCPTLGEK